MGGWPHSAGKSRKNNGIYSGMNIARDVLRIKNAATFIKLRQLNRCDMKWAYSVKDKTKAIAVLLLIIVLILVNNIANRKTFSNLNEHITSIYKDRLMPATYIFQITDHLYQKRLLQNQGDRTDASNAKDEAHNKAIAGIIKTYETTYLTPAEKKQWILFKHELEAFNRLSHVGSGNEKAIEISFNKVLKSLNALSETQASEGNYLFKQSSLSINGTIIMSHLEIALLLILGVIALVLLNANDNRFSRMQNPYLN
jgi:hypothetical protein